MKEKVQIQFGMVFFLLLIIFCGQRVEKTTFQEQIRNHNIHGKILKEQNPEAFENAKLLFFQKL